MVETRNLGMGLGAHDKHKASGTKKTHLGPPGATGWSDRDTKGGHEAAQKSKYARTLTLGALLDQKKVSGTCSGHLGQGQNRTTNDPHLALVHSKYEQI